MKRLPHSDGRRGWPERLIGAIERAAQAGWAQTARTCVLLTVASAAAALIIAISR